jgi:nucleoside-diphosphate-sugar epimerase
MKILITGGNGFLAQHLVTFLSKEHTVIAPGKDKLDCLDTGAVNTFFDHNAIDVVIHTALIGREDLFSTDDKYYKHAIRMWNNIHSNRNKFKQLIQFGSAYELNISHHNNNASIGNVLTQLPTSSYGSAKNSIAESCILTPNFYTLRLFGNMHYTEKDFRFFKKLSTSTKFVINEDRQFDYFNLEDILTTVNFVIDTRPHTRDINLVYKDKLTLSEQVDLFCDVNKIKPEVIINAIGFNLTGDSTILDSFNLPLQGLVKGFEKYSQVRMS